MTNVKGITILIIGLLVGTFGGYLISPTHYVISSSEAQDVVNREVKTGLSDLHFCLSVNSPAASGGNIENTLAWGFNAALSLITGTNNVLIGHDAGWSLQKGSCNFLIGESADVPEPTTDFFLNLDNQFCADLKKKEIVPCPKRQ